MGGERAASVLMTADTVGGVWTYAVELSRALVHRGWRVHLATMGAPVSPAQRAQVEGVAGLVLHESDHRLEWMPEPWTDVDRAGEWLLSLARRWRPHVVHLNQFAFGALPFDAPTLLVAHSCVLSWWRAVHGQLAPAEWDTYRERVAQGLAGARRVGAPTADMLQSLALDYGWNGEGTVLPNGRDATFFRPGTKSPVVFAAGRLWDEAKNLRALEQVAPQLPWPVRVAGSCAAPGGGVREPRGVVALGELPADEVAREMAAASIYALPARYEPFGLSVLEAALSGCALVLGDIGSLRETWDGAAVFVEPGDTAALQDALRALISDADRRAELGRAARERGLQYQPHRMAQAVLDAYQSLLRPRRQPAPEEPACAS